MRSSNAPDLADDPNRLIPARALRTLLGDASNMTIWRWRSRHQLPSPIKINGRNYWRLGEVLAWIEARASLRDAAQPSDPTVEAKSNEAEASDG